MKIDLTLVNDGNVKALAAVTGQAMTIRNFKVIAGKGGRPFVSQPQFKSGDTWQDLILFNDDTHLKKIKAAILEAYNDKIKG